MVIKEGKFMSAYSSSETFHSMTAFVCDNRTGELCRRGIISSSAVLYRIMSPKAGYYYSSALFAVRAEDKSENT